MSSVAVVGSGPSGVHLAQTLLARGHLVTMLDVGHQGVGAVLPDADFDALKDDLPDPVAYFLGPAYGGVILPSRRPTYYAQPPSKAHVFAPPEGFSVETDGFEPVISFASGGLAEAWSGGSYPLNEAELEKFPISESDLTPHYAEVIRRIGVSANRDDIERSSRWFDDYQDPLPLDPHSQVLIDTYSRRREHLNGKLRLFMGRSRVAVLSKKLGDREACSNSGRCLWGCPRQALYAPSSTLRQLRQHPNFRYVPGVFVTHFSYEDGKVTGILARETDGCEKRFEADAYALAAGTIGSAKLYLDSIYRRTGQVHQLGGLMDNRQIMMPFLTPSLLGRKANTHAYQFHQLALVIDQSTPEELIHGQITCLKSVSAHPIAQNLPLDLRSSLSILRLVHVALGVANLWLSDQRVSSNVLTIRPREGVRDTDLVIRYSAADKERVANATLQARKGFRALGCFVPPSMTRVLPSGSSVHYAGLLPMQDRPDRFATDAGCCSHEFRNLYVADGATFPSLPAKNLTFTLMANAIRVGESIANRLERMDHRTSSPAAA